MNFLTGCIKGVWNNSLINWSFNWNSKSKLGEKYMAISGLLNVNWGYKNTLSSVKVTSLYFYTPNLHR